MGGRAFDLLQALLARRGQVVTKRDLLEQVWPGVVVEENNLQVQMCALRKLLGPHSIITVAGRGYEFDAGIEVRELAGGAPEPKPRAHAPTDPARLRGREAELAALAQLVRDARVVTVTGPGGVGKSRLLREVVGRRDHVRVDLASEHVRGTVAARVAATLDLTFVRTPSARQLADAVAGRSMLIVLENPEAVADQAAELADALESAPGVQLACTSQVPLKARGERVLRLAPLALPNTDDVRGAMRNPAVMLLLDAVSALQPRGEFDEGELRDAVAICRHTDGLPLAIDLAGARVPLLGVAGVRRSLGDRFRLLAGGSRSEPTRHRSLLACLEASWGLLTARERTALAAIAQHPARMTLGMIRHVLRPIVQNDWDAMDLLGTLVDKSVVLADPGSRVSFRLLESMRLYVAQCSNCAFRETACG